ncbi:MAG: hypothetical protein GOU98_01315 [Candidatus Altiarchaeota archaeon]|nr:hypothetical protein [Candidatus Altiarchaeota archaeon]
MNKTYMHLKLSNIMKKSILIIDWLMILVFVVLVLSKFVGITTPAILQPIFMLLIGIHIIQHWKIIIASLKQLKK